MLSSRFPNIYSFYRCGPFASSFVYCLRKHNLFAFQLPRVGITWIVMMNKDCCLYHVPFYLRPINSWCVLYQATQEPFRWWHRYCWVFLTPLVGNTELFYTDLLVIMVEIMTAASFHSISIFLYFHNSSQTYSATDCLNACGYNSICTGKLYQSLTCSCKPGYKSSTNDGTNCALVCSSDTDCGTNSACLQSSYCHCNGTLSVYRSSSLNGADCVQTPSMIS